MNCFSLHTGIIAVILFFLTRTFVLRSKHAFQRAFVVLPAVVWLTFFIILIFIIQTVSGVSPDAPLWEEKPSRIE